MRLIFLFGLLVLDTYTAWPHGDLHEQIIQISAKIKESPQDHRLFQKRGELYLQHEEYAKALHDFRHCERSGLISDRLRYCLASTYFHMGSYRRSLRHLTSIKQDSCLDIKTSRLIARAYAALGKIGHATAWYDLILRHAVRTRPENYLELAKLWGDQQDNVAAIAVLQSGIENLGYVPSLTKPLLAYYKKSGRYTEAIHLQTRTLAYRARPEFDLHERALLHQLLGHQEAYRSDLLACKEAINIRPSHIKSQTATVILIQDLDRRLAVLNILTDD